LAKTIQAEYRSGHLSLEEFSDSLPHKKNWLRPRDYKNEINSPIKHKPRTDTDRLKDVYNAAVPLD
jgi:hypothetical protein